MSTFCCYGGLNWWMLYVNTYYVDPVVSTFFVKWFLNDIFGLLCDLSNGGLCDHILLLWWFKLMNAVC